MILLIALSLLSSYGGCSDYENSIVGINWSPFHHPDYSEDNVISVVKEDFEKIANSGFDFVRTFYSAHYGNEIAEYASNYGLKLALGVYMYASHESWTTKQMTYAVNQAVAYPDVVKAIFIGNENVRVDGSGDFTVDELISYIEQMKTLLEDEGITHIPVGTVQRYTEWKDTDNSISQLADACDIIGVNLYPYYADGVSYDENIDVTETGFASGGSDCNSEQISDLTEANQQLYFENVKEWANSKSSETNVFYYAYFDKETSENQDDLCNNFMGLATAEGNLKYDI